MVECFVLCLFFVFWWFYKRTRAQNSEWTEAAVSIGTHHSSDVSRKRTTSVKQSFNQKQHYSCLAWSQGENWTVVCHLLLVHSVQSSQSSELRSSKGFEKTFCFRLLTSFTEILFLFQKDLESARRVKLRATSWLAVALLCLTDCSNNTDELKAGIKATWCGSHLTNCRVQTWK